MFKIAGLFGVFVGLIIGYIGGRGELIRLREWEYPHRF